MTSTHTYAKLAVSNFAFNEIKAKLLAAGYADQIHETGKEPLVDMHGIALVPEVTAARSMRLRRAMEKSRCMPRRS